MEGGVKELAVYRMERAREMLEAAESNLDSEQIRTSLNRSYYAVFPAIWAVNCLEGFDFFQTIPGVIAFFNKTFLKEGRDG